MAFWGMANAGGNVTWALWVTKLADKHAVAEYMSVHTFLTGVRGLIAPSLAFGLIKEGAEPGELSARLRGDDGTPQLSSDDKVSLLCDSFYQKLGSPLARRALELICASADEIEAGDLIGTASLLSPGLEPGSFQQKVLQRLMSMGLVRKTRADDPQQCRYAPVNRRVRAYYLGRLRQRQRSYMALRGALAEHYAATCRRRGGENWVLGLCAELSKRQSMWIVLPRGSRSGRARRYWACQSKSQSSMAISGRREPAGSGARAPTGVEM